MSGLSKTCGSCTYFRRFQVGSVGGGCHARPPVPILIGMQKHPETGQVFPQVNSFWPIVADGEWCGDWGRALPDAVALEKLRLDEPVGQG